MATENTVNENSISREAEVGLRNDVQRMAARNREQSMDHAKDDVISAEEAEAETGATRHRDAF